MNARDAIEELRTMRTHEDDRTRELANDYPTAAKRWRAKSEALSLAIIALEREDSDARNRSAPSSFGSDP